MSALFVCLLFFSSSTVSLRFSKLAAMSTSLGTSSSSIYSSSYSLDNLPPELTSDVPGTWAFDTMSRRIHEEILPRIIADNAEELSRPSHPSRSECLFELRDLESSLKCGGKLTLLAFKTLALCIAVLLCVMAGCSVQ